MIAKVMRSRRIWMNSLTTMAQKRAGEILILPIMTATLSFGLTHKMNENILQARIDLSPAVLAGAIRCDGALEHCRIIAADTQRSAERHRLFHAGNIPELFGQSEQIGPAD